MTTQPIIFLEVRGTSRDELVKWFKEHGTARWSVSPDLNSCRQGPAQQFTVTVRGEELAMLVKLTFQAETIQH